MIAPHDWLHNASQEEERETNHGRDEGRVGEEIILDSEEALERKRNSVQI